MITCEKDLKLTEKVFEIYPSVRGKGKKKPTIVEVALLLSSYPQTVYQKELIRKAGEMQQLLYSKLLQPLGIRE